MVRAEHFRQLNLIGRNQTYVSAKECRLQGNNRCPEQQKASGQVESVGIIAIASKRSYTHRNEGCNGNESRRQTSANDINQQSFDDIVGSSQDGIRRRYLE